MNLKGKISSEKDGLYKVFFNEKDFVSPYIPKCIHIGSIAINDTVIVSFLDNSLIDGAIVGKL